MLMRTAAAPVSAGEAQPCGVSVVQRDDGVDHGRSRRNRGMAAEQAGIGMGEYRGRSPPREPLFGDNSIARTADREKNSCDRKLES